MEKVNSCALDERLRRKHAALLVFAGLQTSTGGLISLKSIQQSLLADYPNLLERFPSYADYFAVSAWMSFFAGLFFLLYPVSLTLWLGRYIVGMSLGYIVLGCKGVAGDFSVPFYLLYATSITVPVLSRLPTLPFYIKNTRYDLAIFLLMSIGLVLWAVYEVLRI